jgi:hypothetical protein
MNDPELFRSLEAAFASGEHALRLREMVRELLASGESRDDLRLLLERYRIHLQATDREDVEDAVLDVLDYLTGFTSPHLKL